MEVESELLGGKEEEEEVEHVHLSMSDEFSDENVKNEVCTEMHNHIIGDGLKCSDDGDEYGMTGVFDVGDVNHGDVDTDLKDAGLFENVVCHSVDDNLFCYPDFGTMSEEEFLAHMIGIHERGKASGVPNYRGCRFLWYRL